MRLFNSDEIKAWDKFTCKEQGINSFQLMQRASYVCHKALQGHVAKTEAIAVCCGPGNNGGDGLLIGAYLFQLGYPVTVYADRADGSQDRMEAMQYAGSVLSVLPLVNFTGAAYDVIIDCLFGHGIKREPEGIYKEIIVAMNASDARKISIDIPSGLPSESIQDAVFTCVRANLTLTFQRWKQSFFFEEYASFCGRIEVLDIGLSPAFLPESNSPILIDEALARARFVPKPRFSHKGTHGSVLLAGGSASYPGAMLLSVGAALASGVGKTFVVVPDALTETCILAYPEAIYLQGFGDEYLTLLPPSKDYKATGIGPGMGQAEETEQALAHFQPSPESHLVVDADALNLIARNPGYVYPENTVITPHPGEFDRLDRKHENSMARWRSAAEYSRSKKIVVVLKGAFTSVFLPDGQIYINSSGNAGLSKGGSGDVLTGFLTGLLGRGYSVEDAVLMGVYLHGKAADCAIEKASTEGLRAGELIIYLRQQIKEWES